MRTALAERSWHELDTYSDSSVQLGSVQTLSPSESTVYVGIMYISQSVFVSKAIVNVLILGCSLAKIRLSTESWLHRRVPQGRVLAYGTVDCVCELAPTNILASSTFFTLL